LKRLDGATESYPESPQFLFDHIKRQEDLISVWLLPDIVLQREHNGFPFEGVLPAQTPVLTEGVAIIKDAPHPEWAKPFYEFVTTTGSASASRPRLWQDAGAEGYRPGRAARVDARTH